MENTGHRSFPNMGGFDPSDLMARPEIRQMQRPESGKHGKQSILNKQMRMAAEKTNMNAANRITKSRQSVFDELSR